MATIPLETKQYVESIDGALRVAGSRVSLDSVVCRFLEGATAEAIVQSFPTLSLESVYGAIAYYLAHRQEVDAYVERGLEDHEADRQRERRSDSALIRKLQRARLSLAS